MTKKKNVVSSGKRKTAIARCSVSTGKGIVRINSKPVEIYEPEMAKLKIQEPLHLAKDFLGKVNVKVVVKGGGVMGQADAVRTAIARGLVECFSDKELKDRYLSYDRTLLVNDPRRHLP